MNSTAMNSTSCNELDFPYTISCNELSVFTPDFLYTISCNEPSVTLEYVQKNWPHSVINMHAMCVIPYQLINRDKV